MTACEPSHRTGRWKLAGMVMIAVAASGVLTACGDDDDTAATRRRRRLRDTGVHQPGHARGRDVDALKAIDTDAGDGLVAELQSTLESIKSDLDAVSADASDDSPIRSMLCSPLSTRCPTRSPRRRPAAIPPSPPLRISSTRPRT